MKGRVMSSRLFGFVLCVCAGLCVDRVSAVDFKTLSDADRKQVNEWMAQRAETMVNARKLDNELRAAWSNPSYTSPEVEKLRARYRELQEELAKAQREIQEKVREVPALQPKVLQLQEMAKKVQEFDKKISEKTGAAR
jgi:chromosome segregation ATPase